MKPVIIADKVNSEPYTFPGGYPVFAITDDGGCLCPTCCGSERERIAESIPGDGFYVVSSYINWEDDALYCDHCDSQIESAYGDDNDCEDN